MDPALILVIVLGFSVVVFVVFAISMMKAVVAGTPVVVEEADPDAAEAERKPDGRPWFARPQTWILFALLFLFIGLFITPKIFGFTFIFFPFFWLRGAYRRQRRNPPPHHR